MQHRRRAVVAATVVGVAGTVLVVSTRRRRQEPAVSDLDHAGHTDDLDGDEVEVTGLDGSALAVHLTGDPSGPVVVLAHCWTGSRHTWAPVTRRLVAAGCRVVRWDQRGHGRSVAGHKGHSIEGLADDLAVVLDELDLHDVVLVGHSMGGMTVQSFASYHHDEFHRRTRGVVLVATAGHGARNVFNAKAHELVRHARVERLLSHPATGQLLVRSTFGRHAHPHHLEATRADFVATPGEVRGEFAAAMQAMDLRAGIARIDVPTTILVGGRDTLTPVPLSRQLAATIPGARLEILPGYGHMLPYEAPDVVAGAVLAHVRVPVSVPTP
jgi:pimeloyl-ACP methyl ester carboxylesterase